MGQTIGHMAWTGAMLFSDDISTQTQKDAKRALNLSIKKISSIQKFM